MSQPEMQPEEAPRRGYVEGVSERTGSGGGGGSGGADELAGAGDLRAGAFPLGDWGQPAERLDELYRWAEARALRTADWYLRDRAWKRRGARVLRLSAVVSGSVGALLPFLGASVGLTGRGSWAWGYVALIAAAACVVADRCFGLTSGWMRDISTAQGVQRRLEAFQFEWASESVREVLGPTEGTATEAAERCLGVLRRFCEDLSELVRVETSEWILEFRSSLAQLHGQASAACAPRPEGGSTPTRIHLLPGSRASMPRQRPPEPPR